MTYIFIPKTRQGKRFRPDADQFPTVKIYGEKAHRIFSGYIPCYLDACMRYKRSCEFSLPHLPQIRPSSQRQKGGRADDRRHGHPQGPAENSRAKTPPLQSGISMKDLPANRLRRSRANGDLRLTCLINLNMRKNARAEDQTAGCLLKRLPYYRISEDLSLSIQALSMSFCPLYANEGWHSAHDRKAERQQCKPPIEPPLRHQRSHSFREDKESAHTE